MPEIGSSGRRLLEQAPACLWMVQRRRRVRAPLRRLFAAFSASPPRNSPGGRSPRFCRRGPRASLDLRASPARSRARPCPCANARRDTSGTSRFSRSAPGNAVRYAGAIGARNHALGTRPNRNCATPCWRAEVTGIRAQYALASFCTTRWARTSPRSACSSIWCAWTWKRRAGNLRAHRRNPESAGNHHGGRARIQLRPQSFDGGAGRPASPRSTGSLTRMRERFSGALRLNVDPFSEARPERWRRRSIISRRRPWRTPCNIPVALPSKSR